MKKQRNREGKRQGLWQVLGFVVLLAAVFVFAGAFAKTNVLAESVGEHDLLPYHTKNVNMYNGNPEYTFTMMGEKYTKGFTRTAFYESRLLYNLDGEVSSVFFTVGHLDGGNTKAAGLKVYLDDIYQESYARTLTGDMMNEKITIPTAGVRKLTVIITESDGDYGFANVTKVGAHNYTSRITKAATAKEDGIREYTCEDCGATFAETVPARKDCEPYIFPYQASQLNKYDEEEGSSRYFTIMGNRYYKGFTKISYYTGTALYNLNAEYNSLRFTVGHLDGGDMNSATLRYYVDNVEMGRRPQGQDAQGAHLRGAGHDGGAIWRAGDHDPPLQELRGVLYDKYPGAEAESQGGGGRRDACGDELYLQRKGEEAGRQGDLQRGDAGQGRGLQVRLLVKCQRQHRGGDL